MARKRKTIAVAEVLALANTFLSTSGDGYEPLGWTARDEQMQRRGVATLLEQILFATGNYHGFGYPDGYVRSETDESRRQYYPAQY